MKTPTTLEEAARAVCANMSARERRELRRLTRLHGREAAAEIFGEERGVEEESDTRASWHRGLRRG